MFLPSVLGLIALCWGFVSLRRLEGEPREPGM
jgi:hypothetical protein